MWYLVSIISSYGTLLSEDSIQLQKTVAKLQLCIVNVQRRMQQYELLNRDSDSEPNSMKQALNWTSLIFYLWYTSRKAFTDSEILCPLWTIGTTVYKLSNLELSWCKCYNWYKPIIYNVGPNYPVIIDTFLVCTTWGCRQDPWRVGSFYLPGFLKKQLVGDGRDWPSG